jgi:hypothetical protein
MTYEQAQEIQKQFDNREPLTEKEWLEAAPLLNLENDYAWRMYNLRYTKHEIDEVIP